MSYKQPKEAAAIYVQRQIEAALTCIATARGVADRHKLKSFAELDLFLAEIGNTYADRRDRFVVSLVVGFGTDDKVSSPEQAVHSALGFITEDDGAAATHWYCFDRKAGILHRIEQGDAESPGK